MTSKMEGQNIRYGTVDLLRAADCVGRLTGAQVACGGAWEDARAFRRGDLPPSAAELAAWMDGDDAAFELLFENPATGTHFFGVRLCGMPSPERSFLLAEILDAACAEDLRALVPALRRVEAALRLASPSLFADPPGLLEIGVLNLWRSVGPCPLWRSGEPPLSPRRVARVLATHPTPVRPHPNPVMLEFACAKPLPHWLGVQISERTARGFEATIERTVAALGLISGGGA